MIPPHDVLVTVLISSILGSLHCIGMCGSLVALCCVSRSPTDSTTIRIFAETAYHVMRLASYLLLGLLAGSLGKTGGHIMTEAGFQRGFGILAGSVLILWGLRDLGVFSLFWVRLFKGGSIQYALSSSLLSLDFVQYGLRQNGIIRGAFTGLISGLLPCGWLYAYVLTAAGTQDPFAGMSIMAMFWAGTVPALFLFARILKKIDSLWLKHIPKITAALVIGLGLLMLSGRMNMIHESVPDAASIQSTCH
jgi:uncharacterized protein